MSARDDDLERALTRSFAEGSDDGGLPDLVEGAVARANRQRRRRDLGVGVGAGAFALALVGGGLLGPRVLGGDGAAGGSIAAAASDSASPSVASAAPTPTPSGSPSDLTLSSAAPTAGSSSVPSETPPTDAGSVGPRPGLIPLEVLPEYGELGTGVETPDNRFADAVGAAPIQGAQICDEGVVADAPGAASVIRPLAGGLSSAHHAPSGMPSSSVSVNLFDVGQGATAFDQLVFDRGFCRWFDVMPSALASRVDDGRVLWSVSERPQQGATVGGLTRAGDVIIGVTSVRPTHGEAVAEVERLLTLTAERARAAMPEAKG